MWLLGSVPSLVLLLVLVLIVEFLFSVQAGGIVDKVKVAAEDKNAEGGLFAVKALADTREPAAEAYVVAMLPIVMEKYADKVEQRPNLETCLFPKVLLSEDFPMQPWL